MKNLMLVGLVIGAASMHVQADDCFDADIGFPCEVGASNQAVVVADASATAKKSQKKDQLRLKFISRRPYLSKSSGAKKQKYVAGDAWVGATYQSDQQPGLEQKRQSNINMISRRAYRAR